MRVLIASPFLPFPLSHGGAVRIYNLCKALADRVDFILVAIREKHDRVRYRELQEVFREVRVVDMDEIPLSDEQLPRQVRQCHSRSFATAIRELVRTHEPDLLQIEYTHMAEYRLADLGIPSILVEHDLTFSLYRQIAGREGTVESWREFETWRRFERRHLREFEGVWTVSEEDRRFAIAEGSKAEMTFAIPNGVDLTRFRPDSGTDSPGVAPEILFVGSFRHLPNLIGFERLVAEVMPRVWQKLPQARLRVVGGPYHDFYLEEFSRKAPARGSAPSVRERAMEPRIKLHGLIEDLRPFYAQAAVVVVPLQVSAGTNIKVLEAMACGKAVVTTAVGCSGLDLRHDDDALICERWDDFATAICGLVSDAELRGRIGRQARRTVKERFGWESIAEWAYKSYAALLSL